MDAKDASTESRCPRCGGSKGPGKGTYTVDFGESLIVIRNVSEMVCEQCGEEWIGAGTARKLEQLTEEAKQRGEQVAIITL